MKQKNIILLVILIIIAGGIAIYNYVQKGTNAPVSSGKVELDRPLVVGLVSWPGYVGGIVANNGFDPSAESIFYKKYGLLVKFVLIEDIDARGKAFVKGGPDGVDVVWSTVDFWSNELPTYVKGGVDARAFMQVDWSRGGDAIVADASIKKIEDLKNKKISLVQYTPSHWLLESVIRASKLTAAEQDNIRKNLIFSQDVPTARAAFIAGQADATVVWEPDVSAALGREGSRILTSSKDQPNLIADVMVAKQSFLAANPKTINAFVRGWFDGVEEAIQNPNLAAKLLVENEPLFAALGSEQTAQSLSWLKWTALEDNIEMFGLNGKPALYDQLYGNSAAVWREMDLIDAVTPVDQSKDDSFLRAIYGKK